MIVLITPGGSAVCCFNEDPWLSVPQRWELAFSGNSLKTKLIHMSSIISGYNHMVLNMVRAGAVRHPREWNESGYKEMRQPRLRYALIDHRCLMDLPPQPDLKFAEVILGRLRDSILREFPHPDVAALAVEIAWRRVRPSKSPRSKCPPCCGGAGTCSCGQLPINLL